ncbi:MAG: hypothetical protein P8107_12320 [Spirochaetia bacterium]
MNNGNMQAEEITANNILLRLVTLDKKKRLIIWSIATLVFITIITILFALTGQPVFFSISILLIALTGLMFHIQAVVFTTLFVLVMDCLSASGTG